MTDQKVKIYWNLMQIKSMGAGLGQFPARSDQIRPEPKLLLGGQVSHLEIFREDQIGT